MERLVWITAPKDKIGPVRKIVEDADGEVLGVSAMHKGRRTVTCLLTMEDRQALFDRIEETLDHKNNWRMVVQDTKAVVPPANAPEDGDVMDGGPAKTREELYEDVADGARLDTPTIALVALSALVAAVGMISDTVAVVIGAMMIAPLLGPILAMILGTALGEYGLIVRAVQVAAAGSLIALAVGVACGALIGFDPQVEQVASRGDVGPENVALALAAGAAAALSLTTGVSAVLVGVMVSVALLPPSVAIGLFLGKALLYQASGAALLFFVNVAAITVAGQIVFLIQGIRPRTWYKQREAKQSVGMSIAFWTAGLGILASLEYGRWWFG